ncbi:unnamed protein product [Effrenium voratum]|uniref:Uncharacterized protein n=1 Tax=Effrenium voratum TaxID=2562239 RepID=A0AA36JNK6_9DINO|nr:unnamed protein product [Effrenium voratum]
MLPWPKVRPRGGGKWSDASSIPGRISANDYEKFVRERLSGSQLQQSEATITAHLSQDACEALNKLKRQSERASAESLGGLWTKLYSSTTANDTPAEATAVTDVVVNAERDLLQSLGENSQLLFGNRVVPEGTVVECTVVAALFFMKCHQLERFLTLAAEAERSVPAVAMVVNKLPIECAEEWVNAIQHYPFLKRKYAQGFFSLVYVPHTLNIRQVQQQVQQVRQEVQQEVQRGFRLRDFAIFLLIIYNILLQIQRWSSPLSSGEL